MRARKWERGEGAWKREWGESAENEDREGERERRDEEKIKIKMQKKNRNKLLERGMEIYLLLKQINSIILLHFF